jgi:hypothetical protein
MRHAQGSAAIGRSVWHVTIARQRKLMVTICMPRPRSSRSKHGMCLMADNSTAIICCLQRVRLAAGAGLSTPLSHRHTAWLIVAMRSVMLGRGALRQARDVGQNVRDHV